MAMGHRLERLNHFLLDRTGGEKYATAFYCLLHSDGRMYYVNAAHCPPMVLRANGERLELEANGMPVGLIETAEFAVHRAEARARRQGRHLQRWRHRSAEHREGILRQEAPARDRGSACGGILHGDSRRDSGSGRGVHRRRSAIGRYHLGGARIPRRLSNFLSVFHGRRQAGEGRSGVVDLPQFRGQHAAYALHEGNQSTGCSAASSRCVMLTKSRFGRFRRICQNAAGVRRGTVHPNDCPASRASSLL